MENSEKAIMMAFAVFVLVIALSLAMFMFVKVTTTSERLAFYSDSTIYYDNIMLTKICDVCYTENPIDVEECRECKSVFPKINNSANDDIKNGTTRIVSTDTVISTLYRYYKENFCVKIYGADNKLIQIFDVNLEGKAHQAAGDTNAISGAENSKNIENYAYNKLYNREIDDNDKKIKYCLFGAPWLGSTESVKTRIDYFINGQAGYINNTYVDYKENDFYKARIESEKEEPKQFKERFISYSYSGQTLTTEDGEELVTGEKSKDKIVIIYTLIN